jgi:hypothetical protein
MYSTTGSNIPRFSPLMANEHLDYPYQSLRRSRLSLTTYHPSAVL